MKKSLLKFLLSIAAMAISLNANAESFTVDGIRYTVLSNYDRTVAVSGAYYVPESGELVIPERVIGEKPYTVVAINDEVFEGQTKLKSITLPNTVITIGNGAFYSCDNLTSIKLGNSVTTIGEYAFCDCGFTSIELPNTLTSIGKHAFSRCDNLISIVIPNLVTKIDAFTFYGCSNLTSVKLGNSVTTIGEQAFSSCGLTSLNIPSSVVEIGDRFLGNCVNLISLTVEEGNQNFRTIDNVLYDKNVTKLIVGCNIPSVVVPSTVETIAPEAFYRYGNLTSVEFQSPSSLTEIGDWAFSRSGLRSITLPNSVTVINDRLFEQCENLSSVKIGNSVTMIGSCAFYGCKSLVSIELPSTVETIESSAFSGSTGLTEFICNALTPPSAAGAFGSDVLKNAVLKVPAEALESYKMTDPWDDFWVYDVIQTSGIDDVTADGEWTVTVEGGTIYISGLDGVTPIEVYSVTGQCAYRGASTEISNLPKGIYIVRIGSIAKKIAL